MINFFKGIFNGGILYRDAVERAEKRIIREQQCKHDYNLKKREAEIRAELEKHYEMEISRLQIEISSLEKLNEKLKSEWNEFNREAFALNNFLLTIDQDITDAWQNFSKGFAIIRRLKNEVETFSLKLDKKKRKKSRLLNMVV